MPAALVASTSIAGGSTTTGAIDTTGADLLVMIVSDGPNGGNTTPTDSKSNTWTGLTAQVDQNGSRTRNRIWYAKNPTVGSGHTFTWNLGPAAPAILVLAFSGADLSAPFDVENGTTGENLTSIQPGSITPTRDGSIIITGIAVEAVSGEGTVSVNSSFTKQESQPYQFGVSYGAFAAYLIQSSAAAVNPTWSFGTGPSLIATTIAAFKAALPAAPTIGRRVEPPAVDAVWHQYLEAHSAPLATSLYLPVPPPPPPPPVTAAPYINPVTPPPIDAVWQEYMESWGHGMRPLKADPLPTLPPTPLPQAGTAGKALLPKDPQADVVTRNFVNRTADMLNSLMTQGRLVQVDGQARKWSLTSGFTALRPPTATDDITTGALPGMTWVNTSASTVYICAENTKGAAVWLGAGTGNGTVTSVAVSGGTTGLTTSGGPITGSGTITLAGTLAIANGGTGATTAAAARTALGLGSIATQAASGVTITGGTIAGTTIVAPGTVTGFGIGEIGGSQTLYVNVANTLSANRVLTFNVGDANRTLTLTGDASVSGTNTGDQTITLTGDVTGSGTGSFAATLSNTGVTAGEYRRVTVDAKGRATAGSNAATGCQVYRSTDLSVANNTMTVVPMDVEAFDTDGYHSTVSNTSRITIPAGMGGKYLITGFLRYAGGATGQRQIQILKNGNILARDLKDANASLPTFFTLAIVADLAATDYIELCAFHVAGASINVETSAGTDPPKLTAMYLGA